MDKLSCHLKFEISKYLTCQEYIKLYLVDKSFSKTLRRDLDLKIPIFVESRYIDGCHKDDIYGDNFKSLKNLIKDIKYHLKHLKGKNIKEEIKNLENDYSCSILTDEGEYRIFEIRVIPKRYFKKYKYRDFNIKGYIYDKIINLNKLKNDKLILEEVLKLNNLALNKSYEEHIEILKRDYLKGKVKL